MTTPFGKPVKQLDLGETEIPIEDFESYLQDIKGQFLPDSYHIFKNNCNHFTNTAAEFLLGEGIPKEILNQSQEFENTPIGKLLEGFQGNMMQQNSGFNMNHVTQPQNPQNVQAQHSKAVELIKDVTQYLEIITGNDRVVIDFYADWCKPCHMIKPIFNQLADQNEGLVKFCCINVDHFDTKELCMNLKVNSMPTFVGFYKGEESNRFSGANQ